MGVFSDFDEFEGYNRIGARIGKIGSILSLIFIGIGGCYHGGPTMSENMGRAYELREQLEHDINQPTLTRELDSLISLPNFGEEIEIHNNQKIDRQNLSHKLIYGGLATFLLSAGLIFKCGRKGFPHV